MPKAICIHRTGGPEVLTLEDVEVGDPRPGQVRIRQSASGVNFIDVQLRRGAVRTRLPTVIGNEGVGVIDAIGADVVDLKIGDRVAYGMSTGSYAQQRLIRAAAVVKLPQAIDDRMAAGMMLKGLTAQYLLRQAHCLDSGEIVLIHAAAGGMGMILTQWASALGATVIGTVSTDEKAAIAHEHGCRHVINYTREDFVQRVAQITAGAKADVVYDAVGADTFFKSLDCLRPTGHIVSYGAAAGPAAPLDISLLGQKGSLTLTRSTLQTYLDLGRLPEMARELFEIVLSGKVRISVNQTYALEDAAQTHRDLESRRTTGSSVLLM